MAGSFNKVILLGNLTRDIELRHISGNNSVANFGLAVNRNWKTPEGEKREEVTFIDCEAWGKTGEIMSQYLKKGRPVFIEGRLKLDTWEDKETHKKQSKLRVVVESFQFVDSKPGGGEGGSDGGGGGGGYRSSGSAPSRGAPVGASSAPPETIEEKDIPF